MSESPREWAPFLEWAEQLLQTPTAPVPLPEIPAPAEACWPLIRLDDPALLGDAETGAARADVGDQTTPLAVLGPLRSDKRTPNFDWRVSPKASSEGKDSLVLLIGGFEVQSEDVGSIEMTLRTPYGRHLVLSWSPLGHLIIPVESHDEAYVVRVLTDGMTDWKGTCNILSLTTDGRSRGVFEIESLRFLPRASSYPRSVGRQRVRLAHEIREAIYARCPAEITYNDLELPVEAKMSVGLGHVLDGASGDAAAVRHQIIVTHGGRRQLVLDRTSTEAREWSDESVSLSQWAGQTVDLTLKTESASPGVVTFWANPVIYQPQDDPPMLVIYLIDTVAAEHVGFQGYSRATMPRLDEAAKNGVWFARMVSNSSRTVESIPDLMLSMPVGRHGVFHNSTPAPVELITISDMLRGAGMATSSFCTNVNAGPRQGMDQGFETFVDKISSHNDDVDRTIPLDEVLSWIDQHHDRPMFLYIHTAEPHSPYVPLAGYRDRFDPQYTGSFTGVNFHDAENQRDIAHIRSLYDEELVYADARFGMFLDSLEERGLLGRAHFFVTSDHGEEFLQHNDWEHGRNLHNEQTRVPLAAFGPTFTRRGCVKTPAQLYDVMPTILEMYDLAAPYALAGQSLLPLLREDLAAGEALLNRDIFASNHNFRIEYKLYEYSIMENGRWKLLFGAAGCPMYRGGPNSRFTLFDLLQDPVEKRNVIHEHQDIARRLVEKLVNWRVAQHVYSPGRNDATIIDSEHMRQLQQLGYAGDDAPSSKIKAPADND